MPQYYKGHEVIFDGKETVTLSSVYVPHLPNTGFEPQSGEFIAFCLVVLLLAGYFFFPYARKAALTIWS